MLFGGLSELLQASYTLSGGQNVLSVPPTRFVVVKTDSPSFCKPPTLQW